MKIPLRFSGDFLGFVEFVIDDTEFFIEAVFWFVQDEVVGSGIGFFEATEGFFKAGEAGPRVIFAGVFRGDAPEIEVFQAFFLGVKQGSTEKTNGGGEIFIGWVGGGLHVIASGVWLIVKEQGSGDDFVPADDDRAIVETGAGIENGLEEFAGNHRVHRGAILGDIAEIIVFFEGNKSAVFLTR